MYPEEVYKIKGLPIPRELLRGICFNVARGLLQDTLKFPKVVRIISGSTYESYVVVRSNLTWWIIYKFQKLDHISFCISRNNESHISFIWKLNEQYMF